MGVCRHVTLPVAEMGLSARALHQMRTLAPTLPLCRGARISRYIVHAHSKSSFMHVKQFKMFCCIQLLAEICILLRRMSGRGEGSLASARRLCLLSLNIHVDYVRVFARCWMHSGRNFDKNAYKTGC